MTKKDYELVASAIKSELEYWRKVKQSQIDLGKQNTSEVNHAIDALQGLVPMMARTLEKHDNHFKRFQFFEDCGLEIKY